MLTQGIQSIDRKSWRRISSFPKARPPFLFSLLTAIVFTGIGFALSAGPGLGATEAATSAPHTTAAAAATQPTRSAPAAEPRGKAAAGAAAANAAKPAVKAAAAAAKKTPPTPVKQAPVKQAPEKRSPVKRSPAEQAPAGNPTGAAKTVTTARSNQARAVVPLRARSGRLIVAGYYPVDWPGDPTALQTVQRYGSRLDAAMYFGYTPDRQGRLRDPYAGDEARFLAAAKAGGIKPLVVVHNYMNGGFNTPLARDLLADPQARRRVVDGIASLMQKGYAGVNIDLEGLPPTERHNFTTFIEELAARLHLAGYLVTIAVPAKTADRPSDAWSGAYDYAALGRIADALMIMSYDEHWLGGSPGPVASLPWVEQVVRYAVSAVPRQKILLGIAAYGYDWVSGGSGRSAMIPAREAPRRAASHGSAIAWDARAQAPWYEYMDTAGNRHIVHFENTAGMALKAELAARYGLGGVAIWRLGFEEPSAWKQAFARPDES